MRRSVIRGSLLMPSLYGPKAQAQALFSLCQVNPRHGQCRTPGGPASLFPGLLNAGWHFGFSLIPDFDCAAFDGSLPFLFAAVARHGLALPEWSAFRHGPYMHF